MESTRKLSNFNFQWTKTLYQNNLKNIAFFFTFSRAKYVISHLWKHQRKFLIGTPRKWMSNFTKLHLTLELFRILPVLSQFLWNLKFIFLRIKITQLPGGFRIKFEVGAKTKGRLNLPRSLYAFENCKRHVKATRWYELLEGVQWTNLFFRI